MSSFLGSSLAGREGTHRSISADRALRNSLKDVLGQSRSSISRLQEEAAEKAAELERETDRSQRLVLERDQAEARARRLSEELEILRRQGAAPPGVATSTSGRAGVKKVSFSSDSTPSGDEEGDIDIRLSDRQLHERLSRNGAESSKLEAIDESSVAVQRHSFSPYDRDRQLQQQGRDFSLRRLSSSGSGMDSGMETMSTEEDDLSSGSPRHLFTLLERVRLADNTQDLKSRGEDVADEIRRLTGGRFGSLERSLKSELEAKESALAKAKAAEEEATFLQLLFSLNKSLSQEDTLKLELLRQSEQVADDYRAVEEQLLRLRREKIQLGDRLLAAQRERNEAMEEAEKARVECQEWRQQTERLGRLVGVLRKRIGTTSSPSVASISSPLTPSGSSAPSHQSDSTYLMNQSVASPSGTLAGGHRRATPVAGVSSGQSRGADVHQRHVQRGKSPSQTSTMSPDSTRVANTSQI